MSARPEVPGTFLWSIVSPSIVVVIREDPRKSGRAVEALRIALGLGTGENPLTVVLLDHAPLLLSEDPEDVVDAEILEKHVPVFKEFRIPFIVPSGAPERFSIDSDFNVRHASEPDIVAVISRADRVVAF
jgi:hypothetical protein